MRRDQRTTMRPSFWRLAARAHGIGPENCIRCGQISYPTIIVHRLVQRRPQSNNVRNSLENENVSAIGENLEVPENGDILNSGSLETRQPPRTTVPPVEESTSTAQKHTSTQKPWHFRHVVDEKMDSMAHAKELRRAMANTSLRKRLHWFPPLYGINPAYDMAVDFLRNDRAKKMRVIKLLEKRIAHERESIS